jgi:lipopolysaccharide transport system permease protein
VRDVAQAVGMALLILFYVTPVFYPLDAVPDRSRWIFDLNPAAVLIDLYRSVLMDGTAPPIIRLTLLAAASLAVFTLGWRVFRRLESGFADEL